MVTRLAKNPESKKSPEAVPAVAVVKSPVSVRIVGSQALTV